MSPEPQPQIQPAFNIPNIADTADLNKLLLKVYDMVQEVEIDTGRSDLYRLAQLLETIVKNSESIKDSTGYFGHLQADQIAQANGSNIDSSQKKRIPNMNILDFLLENPTYLGDYTNKLNGRNENLITFVGQVLFIDIKLNNHKTANELVQLALIKVLFAHLCDQEDSLFFANINGGTGFLMRDISDDDDFNRGAILKSITSKLSENYPCFDEDELETLAMTGLQMVITLANKGLPENIEISEDADLE